MKALSKLLLLVALATLVAACDDDTTNPGAAPKVASFTATPATIGPGDSTRLDWSLDGTATTVTIDNGIGDVSSVTSKMIWPVATTTFTITATNENGSSTKTVTVTVENPGDPGAPAIPVELVASPGNPGIINVSWPASTGAASYQLERRAPGGAFTLVASPIVNSFADVGLFPGSTFTYRVRALNAAGAHSGWSRYATATVPGTAPVVTRISITPTAPPTLRPGGSVQFTAVAYDESNNDLHLAQNLFSWQSSNPLVLSIDAVGKATAGTQLGSATISATIGETRSNEVNVSVAQQAAPILAIFHGRNEYDDDFSLYEGALTAAGADYDKITDSYGNQAPAFTFDQVKNYQRIVLCVRYDNPLNGATIGILKKYLDQAGKRLIIISHSSIFNGDAGFRSYIGLNNDGYLGTDDIEPTVTGGAGTIMEGMAFDRIAVTNYVSNLTLKTGGIALPALTGHKVSDGSEVILALQATMTSGSKIFYSGLLLENMDPDVHNAFLTRLTTTF